MHLGVPCIPRKKPKQQEKTTLTSRKKLASWPCPGRQSISRSCGTTTARRSAPTHSVKVIWSCAESGTSPSPQEQAILPLGGSFCCEPSPQEQFILPDRL